MAKSPGINILSFCYGSQDILWVGSDGQGVFQVYNDGIQFDKASPAQLMDWCEQIRNRDPSIAVLAAGGIRPDNAEDYALSGVHGLVLSSVYHAPPADLEVRIVAL